MGSEEVHAGCLCERVHGKALREARRPEDHQSGARPPNMGLISALGTAPEATVTYMMYLNELFGPASSGGSPYRPPA